MNGAHLEPLITRYQPSNSTLVSFRQVPAFGEAIRRFDSDVSEMKRLAGHDFEDILQASWHLDYTQTTTNSWLIVHYSLFGGAPR